MKKFRYDLTCIGEKKTTNKHQHIVKVFGKYFTKLQY